MQGRHFLRNAGERRNGDNRTIQDVQVVYCIFAFTQFYSRAPLARYYAITIYPPVRPWSLLMSSAVFNPLDSPYHLRRWEPAGNLSVKKKKKKKNPSMLPFSPTGAKFQALVGSSDGKMKCNRGWVWWMSVGLETVLETRRASVKPQAWNAFTLSLGKNSVSAIRSISSGKRKFFLERIHDGIPRADELWKCKSSEAEANGIY